MRENFDKEQSKETLHGIECNRKQQHWSTLNRPGILRKVLKKPGDVLQSFQGFPDEHEPWEFKKAPSLPLLSIGE